jgi:hypothetical protein
MEKVSCKDEKTNEETLALVGEESGIVQSVMRRKTNCTCCSRKNFENCDRRKGGGPETERAAKIGITDDLNERFYTEMKTRRGLEIGINGSH